MTDLMPAERIEGLDYFAVLFKRRLIVIICVAAFMVIGFVIGMSITPQFTATATAVPAVDESAQDSAAGALSGLSFLTGRGVTSRKDIAVALLDARTTLQQFIVQNNLLPVLFQNRRDVETGKWKDGVKPPTLEEGYLTLKARVKVDQDTVAGLIKLNVTWRDSDTAARWCNGLMKLVNDAMQSNAVQRSDRMISYLNPELDHIQNQEVRTNVASLIQEQIKAKVLAKSNNNYALDVIDPALPTTAKSSLGKGMLTVLGMFVGLVVSILLAFLLEAMAVRRARRTPR